MSVQAMRRTPFRVDRSEITKLAQSQPLHSQTASRMSESPASLMTITPTLYILPQAVPIQSIMRTGAKMVLTELNVVSVEVVNLGLGEHGVVFKFCSSNGRGVVSNKDEL